MRNPSCNQGDERGRAPDPDVVTAALSEPLSPAARLWALFRGARLAELARIEAQLREVVQALGSPTTAEVLGELHRRWPESWRESVGRPDETWLGLQLRRLGFAAVQQREDGRRVRRYSAAKPKEKPAHRGNGRRPGPRDEDVLRALAADTEPLDPDASVPLRPPKDAFDD